MRRSLGPILALFIVVMGVSLHARRSPAVFTNAGVLFTDPDDYMRLYRVRELLEGHSRRVKWMPEINWPKGGELHWTMPMDYLLAGSTRAFGPMVGGTEQEQLDRIAAWTPVALGAIYSLCLMGLLARACGWPLALIIGGTAVCSPAFHRPFALGHPDHHCFLEVLFLLAVLLWIPKRTSDGSSGIPAVGPVILSGLIMGMALWVAPQAMAVWLAILVGATFTTYHAAPEARATWASRRFEWNCGVFFMAASGFLMENWPKLSAASVDKISVFHVALVLLAFLAPSGTAVARPVRLMNGIIRGLRHWTPLAGGFLLFAVWMVTRSDHIFGPLISPEFIRCSERIVELQPLWTRAGGELSLSQMHARLGALVYTLPVAVWLFMRNKMMPCGLKWTFGLMAIGFTAMAVMQRRWLDHVTLGLVVVTVVGIWQLFDSALVRPQINSVGRRVLLTSLLVAALLFPTYHRLFNLPPALPMPLDLRTATIAHRINEWESRVPASGIRRAILCDEAEGSMLAYRTRLPIVAAPYHRTTEGIVESARFYAERDDAAAMRQLERLGVKYVVVPFRPHERLMNFERIAFDELRSYDPPSLSIDENGAIHEVLHYRPGIQETMAYRLAIEPDRPPAELKCIAKIKEGARTSDGYSGLLYMQTAAPAPARRESEL